MIELSMLYKFLDSALSQQQIVALSEAQCRQPQPGTNPPPPGVRFGGSVSVFAASLRAVCLAIIDPSELSYVDNQNEQSRRPAGGCESPKCHASITTASLSQTRREVRDR